MIFDLFIETSDDQFYPHFRPSVSRLTRYRPARQGVGRFVEFVAVVAADPEPAHLVPRLGFIEPLPQVDVLHRFLVGGGRSTPPAIFYPRRAQSICPWTDHRNAAICEVGCVSSGDGRVVRTSDRRDLCIELADWPAQSSARRRDLGKFARCSAIERQNPSCKVLAKEPRYHCLKRGPSLAGRQHGDPVENFSFAN